MGLTTCKGCGTLMDSIMGRMCKNCKIKDEEYLTIVMDFLRDNPGSTLEEIHLKTEVPKPVINKFIKRGKLVSADFKMPCSVCGQEFKNTYSTMCEKCGKKMNKEIRNIKQKEEERKTEDKGFKKTPPAGKDDGSFGSVVKRKR